MSERKRVCTVWIYGRSRSQNGAVSKQVSELLEEAERRGDVVAGASQDQADGRDLHRAGLKAMMDTVRRGNADTVMIGDRSRFSHDNKALFRILCFLQDHGAVLVTAGTDLRYELSLRGLERPLRKRALQRGCELPW